MIGKIWLISQPGYLLPIRLNPKVVCPKILKVKPVSLVPTTHVRIRHNSENDHISQFSLIFIIKFNLGGTRSDLERVLVITLLKGID